MPNYSYECTNTACRHQFTVEARINEEPNKHCPRCSIEGKRIYVANVNLNFNGSYNNTRK